MFKILIRGVHMFFHKAKLIRKLEQQIDELTDIIKSQQQTISIQSDVYKQFTSPKTLVRDVNDVATLKSVVYLDEGVKNAKSMYEPYMNVTTERSKERLFNDAFNQYIKIDLLKDDNGSEYLQATLNVLKNKN